MTDEEALANMPAVMEFASAVEDRDSLVVEACMKHTDPRLLAVWCAELWSESEHDAAGLRAELSSERRLLADARAELQRVVDAGGPVNARLAAENRVLAEKVRELRVLLDAKAVSLRRSA